MKPKDDLFRLIKSLSKNEKGYFTKYSANSAQGKSSNSLKLFNAIDKQEEYDEEKIKKQFRKENFVKQLHVAKNYLFGQIMESLELYHTSVDSEIQNQLHRLEILFEKGFYDICEELLPKIKEKAWKNERFTYVMECLFRERNLIFCGARPHARQGDLDNLIQQGEETLSLMKNSFDYKTIRDQLTFFIAKSGMIRHESRQSDYDKIMKHPLLESEDHALTFNNKILFNQIFSLYNYYSHNQEGIHKGIQYKKRLLELIESNPELIRTQTKMYYAVLMDLLSLFSEYPNYPEFSSCLKKLRSISITYQLKLSTDLQAKIFFGSSINELNLYVQQGWFEKIKEINVDLEKGFKKLNAFYHGSNKVILYYNIAYMHFGNADYRSALKWLNKILNEQEGTRPDILCFSKLFLLLVQFELNNTDILPYLVTSTERFLVKHGRNFKCEKLLLAFFKKSLKINSKEDFSSLLKTTHGQLLETTSDPFEKKALYYFDFISWMESKITGKTFAEIVRGKVKKN